MNEQQPTNTDDLRKHVIDLITQAAPLILQLFQLEDRQARNAATVRRLIHEERESDEIDQEFWDVVFHHLYCDVGQPLQIAARNATAALSERKTEALVRRHRSPTH